MEVRLFVALLRRAFPGIGRGNRQCCLTALLFFVNSSYLFARPPLPLFGLENLAYLNEGPTDRRVERPPAVRRRRRTALEVGKEGLGGE